MTEEEYRRKKKRERDREYYRAHRDEILLRRKQHWASMTEAQKLRRREYNRVYQMGYKRGITRREYDEYYK